MGCGLAAWLTPLEEQPTTGGPNSIEVAVPRDGLRVQNGAYDAFAPDPVRGPNLPGIETRRRGLYLVRPNLTSVDACFMCTPLGGPVEIVARVDPLTIPAGATASPGPSPTSPRPSRSSPTGVEPLTDEEILAAPPDSNLDPALAARVAVIARRYVLGGATNLGPEIGSHLLLAASVMSNPNADAPGSVYAMFHDYTDGTTIDVALDVAPGREPVPLEAFHVTAASVRLSAWETGRLTLILGTLAGGVVANPWECSVSPGWCVAVSKPTTRAPNSLVNLLSGRAVPWLARPSPAPTETSTVGLTLKRIVRQGCGSFGGCAYFARLTPLGLAAAGDVPWLEFPGIAGELHFESEAPTSIARGTYRVSARENFVSDAILNGQRVLGPVTASCEQDVTISELIQMVTLSVVFHGDRPCEIEVTGRGALH